MLNVGLLGAGRIAGVHAKAFAGHKERTLVAVADVVEANAQKLTADYGGAAKGADAIIVDVHIDAILIATSTDTHSDFIEKRDCIWQGGAL